MAHYNFVGVLVFVSLLAVCIRYFILWRKSIPMSLFAEALKSENDGFYEEAATAYETALNKIGNIRFHRDLRNKIVERVKVLHTLIEYNNRFHSIR